jgi:exodeoxyribonuclease VII large subunit
VAEAIHESEIPVVSAVGHEVDFTISDFTADARAETPSAAAAMVVPVRAELEERLSEMETLLRQNTGRTLQGLFDRLESFRNHYLFREPATKIRECVQRLDELSIALKTRMENGFVLKREALRRAGDLLQSLSPFAVLERGYSITRAADSGKTVRRAGDVRAGELLVTRLFEGEVYSEARENPGKTGGKTAGKDSR